MTVVLVFRQLSLPPILGYLLVGTLVVPHALGFVRRHPRTSATSPGSACVPQFSIGLEFSLPQLNSMRRIVFGLGLGQVAIVAALGLAAAVLAGETWSAGMVLGGVVAMSSTAIVSKMLSEKLQLHSPHGRQIMGVLLFQDLAVIPLMLIRRSRSPVADRGRQRGGPPQGGAGAGRGALPRPRMCARSSHGARQKSSELFMLFVCW